MPSDQCTNTQSFHDNDGDQDRGFGRMQPMKENATTPAEKALWEYALSQVCKDECEDLLHMMKNETKHLANDVGFNHFNHPPFA